MRAPTDLMPGETLTTRRLRLETQHEPIVLMHADCPVARSEGFTARAQVELQTEGRSAIATLDQVSDSLLGVHEVGLSEIVWTRLGVEDGAAVTIRHPQPIESMSAVRAKLYGHRLDSSRIDAIYAIPAIAATATPAIADWVRCNVDEPVIIGPDEESGQWVERIADLAGARSTGLRKQQSGDFSVTIDERGLEHLGRGTPVLVDDIASSGRTLIEAAQTFALEHQAH